MSPLRTGDDARQRQFLRMESPVGALLLTSDGQALTSVHFAPFQEDAEASDRVPSVLHTARAQLEEYFARERRDFDVPLSPAGTPFQLRVWSALRSIRYGETASYGEIARRLMLPVAAARAVGVANGRNPIAVIVPCHRVIGSNGSLTGYAGGLERKRTLLALEAPSLF